ncbi:hypothetical protein LguiB_005512 [Lonicera macranthoides]
MGNFHWSITIPTRKENENNFNALVEKIKNGKMEIQELQLSSSSLFQILPSRGPNLRYNTTAGLPQFRETWLRTIIYSYATSPETKLLNMRPKMLPPLPESSMGNLYWPISIPTKNESENNFNTLVRKIKKGKMEIEGMKNVDATKHLSIHHEYACNNYSFFLCSSLCRMKFYQVDFGWGYPSRVNLADTPINNCFLLMDTPCGDGIEALVSLEEQDMVSFELDKEINMFSSSSSITKAP